VSTKCLNYRNINGFTPLHLACQADKPECVKELLVCGADVNIPAGAPVTNVTENKLPGIVKEYLQDNHKKLFVEVRTKYCLNIKTLHKSKQTKLTYKFYLSFILLILHIML